MSVLIAAKLYILRKIIHVRGIVVLPGTAYFWLQLLTHLTSEHRVLCVRVRYPVGQYAFLVSRSYVCMYVVVCLYVYL